MFVLGLLVFQGFFKAIALIRKPETSKSENYGIHPNYVGDTSVMQSVSPPKP